MENNLGELNRLNKTQQKDTNKINDFDENNVLNAKKQKKMIHFEDSEK